ncbi:YqhR family membrane protein [Bacillus sp. 179-C3.3 HS]|uniref:YqhR family membrane protein n=1 Tax=Bacillus sp. 179-C3.3 HS TaxID=3232162 RepID=UPI00399FBA01
MKRDEKKNQNQEEKNQSVHTASMLARAAATGFVGGVFWGFIGFLTYIFHFSEVSPNMLLQPFVLGDWKKGGLGTFISIVLLGILSIGVAFIYYALLKRIKGIWMALIYGGLLWVLVFYVFNPIFPDVKQVHDLHQNTIVTTFCLYVLYGLFVGYSISFEYNELTSQKLARALGKKAE